jgi:hypothetical protein
MERWVYDLSLLALLVPMFFVTVWVEKLVAGKILRKRTDWKFIAKRWSLLANLASYSLLAITLSAVIIIGALSPTQEISTSGTTPLHPEFVEENEEQIIAYEHNKSFGHSVSITSEFIVVGAYLDNSGAGSVFIYQKDEDGNNKWGLVKKITASDGNPEDHFGISVSISGDTLVVGAARAYFSSTPAKPGSVYVFQKNYEGENNWGEMKKIVASGGSPGDNFGASVSISGDTLVVGDTECTFCDRPTADAAYIFKRHYGGTNNWGQIKKLVASDGAEGDDYGNSVYISGDTVVVGAKLDDDEGFNSGSAYIYQRNEGGIDSWGEVKKITAPDGSSYDRFGHAVSVTGDTVIISALDDSSAGSVYIFKQNYGGNKNWGLVQKLTAFDRKPHSNFGFSVSIEKDSVLIVDHKRDGSAYFFQANQSNTDNWKLRKMFTPSDSVADNEIIAADPGATSISISSATVVVGGRGKAYIYYIPY